VQILVTLGVWTCVSAGAWEVKSGPQRTGLLELYTSEGCSSCPPAEEWLSGLRETKGLWDRFVPVAFHVDYWDGLGWEDRFADAVFTVRQQAYAKVWNAATVYTPGMVWNGTELRNWLRFEPDIALSAARPGVLTARSVENGVETVFSPADEFSGGAVSVAWLGIGRKTDVKAGENRGRRLAHDFVVLKMRSVDLKSRENGKEWTARVEGGPPDADAVAVWVSGGNSPAPVQAAGGML